MMDTRSFDSLNIVTRATSAELAQEAITRAILLGEFRPGDPLTEVDLANRLGVSRGPVREALAELERMGLVDKIPYKGSFVSYLTEDDVRELYTVREHLEGLAARCIAERKETAAENAAKLEAILAQMHQIALKQDPATLVELDLQFHRSLFELSGHKLLIQIWEHHLETSLKRFLFLKQNRLYMNPIEAITLHQPIVDAICSGDADKAEAVAKHHVIEAGNRNSIKRSPL